jgi:hypothetical protein
MAGTISVITMQLSLDCANAQQPVFFQGNITSLTHQHFGGENIGTYNVIILGKKIGINIHLHKLPQPGYIFEARLVNTRTNTSLNLGPLSGNNSLLLSKNNISLLQYNLLIITQQAANRTDTKHSQSIGGAILRTPFGGNFNF